MTTTPDMLTEKPRISSIDLMRGLVMVIMALDHTRDFFHADAFIYDPTDLDKTNPALFFTRIITHYCAPTFVLLSGVAIRISQQRKSKNELAVFLLTRGLWLILLEVTVIRFSWFFNFYYDTTIFQVIWAIGISMVILSALLALPSKAIVAMGVIITLSHDLLHAVKLEADHPFFIPYTFIHQVNFIELFPGVFAYVNYPILPWLGIMLLGYGLGAWYTNEVSSIDRKQFLLRMGATAIVAFIVLRLLNVYGDPSPWSSQKNALYTFMSFINVTKYPASLLYTLMTLGPVLLLLAWMESVRSSMVKPFIIFGRVPLFYYVLHLYFLHTAALLLYLYDSGKSLREIDFHFSETFGGLPAGAGYALVWTYVAWIAVVLLLYPLCKWYNGYKSRHTYWWLSYL